jgi:hypothetical protein
MNEQALLTLVYALLLSSGTQAARDSFMNHNWQAAFFSENVEQPRKFIRGPPSDSDEKIPLVVTNKCDSTIWPGVATQSGTGPGIGGFELATNKSRKL